MLSLSRWRNWREFLKHSETNPTWRKEGHDVFWCIQVTNLSWRGTLVEHLSEPSSISTPPTNATDRWTKKAASPSRFCKGALSATSRWQMPSLEINALSWSFDHTMILTQREASIMIDVYALPVTKSSDSVTISCPSPALIPCIWAYKHVRRRMQVCYA